MLCVGIWTNKVDVENWGTIVRRGMNGVWLLQSSMCCLSAPSLPFLSLLCVTGLNPVHIFHHAPGFVYGGCCRRMAGGRRPHPSCSLAQLFILFAVSQWHSSTSTLCFSVVACGSLLSSSDFPAAELAPAQHNPGNFATVHGPTSTLSKAV